jgi:hypothetical protein
MHASLLNDLVGEREQLVSHADHPMVAANRGRAVGLELESFGIVLAAGVR